MLISNAVFFWLIALRSTWIARIDKQDCLQTSRDV